MNYPFADASVLHFEVDNLGEGHISVVLDNGHIIDCDRVDVVMVEQVPVVVASIAVQEGTDEPLMYPRDVIPFDNVRQIHNPTFEDVEHLGVQP